MKLFLASLLALAAATPVFAVVVVEEKCLDDSAFETDGEQTLKVECSRCNGGYFYLKDMPFGPGEARAWCVDLDRDMNTGSSFSFDTYSSYADDIPASAMDKAENLPKVNYLLNTYRDTDICGSVPITYKEVQQTIWNLIDHKNTHSSVNGYNAGCVAILTEDAHLNGESFKPCDVDGDAVLGLVVIVDNDDGNIQKQVLVTEVPAVCESCAPEVAAVVGDPHIYTFDGLTNDCQADGEFILLKSKDTSRQVQTRFAHFTELGFWSVTKSLVVQDAAADSPVVQVNVPVLASSYAPNNINGCPVQFFVDGAQRNMDDGSGQDEKVLVANTGTEVEIFYVDTGFRVTISGAHGAGSCFLNQVIHVPHNDNSIIGLLGTPNGNPMDDWTTRDGTPIEVPTSFGARTAEDGYNYCTTNWCIRDATESLYTHVEAGIDFTDFMHCDLTYGGTIQDIIANAPQEILDLCGDDDMCIVDGVAGGVEAAQATIDARQAVQETCNAVGGECAVASCCDGLICVAGTDGDKVCAEPAPCQNCWGDSTGSCQDKNNNVCFSDSDGVCPPGTDMCHASNIFEEEPAPLPECTGCWGATTGVCKAASGVCYPLVGGICPGGTFTCEGEAVRRRLRGAQN